ncbi:MAG: GGDEF domain-containing protein [Terracidiphilus sp.]|jgi:diguanylate cyclase (GGDEF)-like protein
MSAGLCKMKKLISTLAILLACGTAAWAGTPLPLTSLRAIHDLTNAEASKGLPVAFQATVTFYGKIDGNLFVQDGDEAIFVKVPVNAGFLPGDRILVRGTSFADFHPDVHSNDVTVLGHSDLPEPIPATFDDLIRIRYDCLLVNVRGTVHAVDRDGDDSYNFTRIQLLTEGGYIELFIIGGNDATIRNMLDAEVEVSGIVAGRFDGKHQPTGIQLYVPSFANIKLLKRADADPWALPVTPMGAIIGSYHVRDLTGRIRVHGAITYYQPGTALALQDGPSSVWITTRTRVPMEIGDVADAIGFPDVHDGFLALTRAEIHDTGVHSPVSPQPSNWTQLTSSAQLFDLVSIEGQVVTEVEEGSQDEYVLRADNKLFTTIFRNPAGPNAPPMKQVPLGSIVRVTGICILSDSNPFDGKVPFNILLRSFDDITVIASPSLLTVRNLGILVGLLLIGLMAVGTRAWFVEHRARQNTAASAYIERRRGRILEDINGSAPITEVIEQITELVSFRLKGAPCWCQIAGGARLGNCPRDLSGMRVVSQEIPARSGSPLGEVFAAFDPLTKPRDIESESLAFAVGLAALAIETRRLYTDLIRRSEFDLLTDIHNRFSLDKRLDAQIEEAHQLGGIFGLIYIDLDNFKRVNDLMGHRIGDLYLQEMALRMKRQLRSVDTLARLGGDEFAILVPLVRSRADVRDIALRLERCFDEPLPIEGVTLHPAASVGFAVYPEDATTKDGLLSFADDAMYKTKNLKRHLAQMPIGDHNPEPELKVL